MPIIAPLKLAYLELGQYVTTSSALYEGKEDIIKIPVGFVTDLASVPRIFWVILPPMGLYEQAAGFHDWNCERLNDFKDAGHRYDPRLALATEWNGQKLIGPRSTDGLFRRMMREGGVPWLVRWHMWMGVRWGALKNPARRAGWWRDAPLVLAITAADLGVLYGLAKLL